MTGNARQRMAGISVAAVLVLGALQWGAKDQPQAVTTGAPVERAASVWWSWPWGSSTTVRRTTTTTLPVTTTTAAPVTTLAPTTTAAPAPTTTKAPAPTTTRPPVTTTAPPPTTAPPAPVGGSLSSSTQQQMLALVNAKRATGTVCGGVAYPAVPPLSLQGNLTAAADAYALDMATYNYFSHTGRDGSDPGTRITRAGYRWSAWGENIAAGQNGAAEVVAAWWASAGHCENFMSSAVTQVGFGMAQNPSTTYRIYWVADMGRPA